jgi:hypothetical protein
LRLPQEKYQEEVKTKKSGSKPCDNIPNLAWMAQAGSCYWYNKNGMTTQEQLEEMQGWGWQSVYKEEELEAILKSGNYH